jgi:hypothetical protein
MPRRLRRSSGSESAAISSGREHTQRRDDHEDRGRFDHRRNLRAMRPPLREPRIGEQTPRLW